MLSIVTPVRNAEPYLEECIRSGLKQSFTDWEWIFVDDNSKDNSLETLRHFSQTDTRISVYANPNTGILPALQLALQQCQGQFLTRMDADDLMPEGRLLKMATALRHAPAQTVVTGRVKYFSDKPLSGGYLTYQDWLNGLGVQKQHWTHLYRECVVASPNWMMRTDELRAIGGFDALDYPEDYDLCFRWYAHGFCIDFLDDLTLLWREHATRTSRNHAHYRQAAFFQLKLKRFIQLDYTSHRPLVLLGKGKKARLSAAIFLEKEIPFFWIAQKEGVAQIGDQKMRILPLSYFQQLRAPQVLVAIYPPEPERKKLETYLTQMYLSLGKNYWYL